jgi:adenosine kinase
MHSLLDSSSSCLGDDSDLSLGYKPTETKIIQFTKKTHKHLQPIKEKDEIMSIIGIGDPIVDISSQVDNELINKLNMSWGDTIFIDEFAENEEIFNDLERMPEVRFIPGGSVQNTLRVLSWCLNMNANYKNKIKVTMLGCVGEDNYKLKLINALKEFNINPLFETSTNKMTSRCGVGIYKKERFLITQLRASKDLSSNFIHEHYDEILSNEAIIIEGYILQNKLDICKKLCNDFKRQNKKIILTLSAIFMVKFHRSKIIEIANDADIIIGNLDEMTELSEVVGGDVRGVFENVFKKITKKENRLLIATHGEAGVYSATYDYLENRLDSVLHYFAIPISSKQIVDFNGAGDSFLGGFLCEYMKGHQIRDCCKIGTLAAHTIIQNVGCTFPKNKNLFK